MPKAPVANAGRVCPLHRKDVSKVCHTCAWYILVRGRNPNTGQDVDNWDCSLAFLPLLQIETASVGRSTAAATEDLRNEVVKTREDRSEILSALVVKAQHQAASLPAAHPTHLLGDK